MPAFAHPLASRLGRWALPAALVAGAAGLNFSYLTLTGQTNPFTLFYPALVISAVLCGRVPAYAGLLGAAALVSENWLPPIGQLYVLEPAARWALAGFAAVSALMIEVATWATRSAQRLRQRERELQSALTQMQVDAAARRAAEDDRASHATLLRLATEAGRVGTWSLDFVSDRNSLSEQAAVLFGTSQREFSAAGWAVLVHPDDRDRVRDAWQRSIETGTVYDIEYRSAAPAPDGTERWFLVRGHILRVDGVPSSAVGVIVDISSRKAAEQALRESERRFRVLADGVPSAIWATDAQGVVEFVNAGYCEFFGLTLQAAQAAQREGWRPTIHPDDLQAYVAAFQRAVSERAPFHARARVRHRSGAWRHIESHAMPRLTPEGDYLGHVGMSPDLTDLLAATDALKESDRRKDVFLATLSHELRNPLSPIRTAAQVLGSPRATAEEVAWVRQVIQRQVKQIARLLDDLLDVSRITQGKLTLRPEWTPLAAVVETAVDTVRPAMERKQHHLTVSLQPEDLFVHADPVRLAQVVGNLLTNAAKYTDTGGRIDLVARQTSQGLEIVVRDNGVGLAADDLPSLFVMFGQVAGESSRAEGGMGIGLALAQGLVELHGGRIEAHSPGRGQGSVFTVLLPASVLSPPLATAVQPAAPAPPSHRVLVVDDNRDSADAVAVLLQLEGHETQVAYTGCEALRLAEAFSPDVVLLDIGLPDLLGYDVAVRLRAQPWARRVVLVAMTGYGQDDDRQKATQAGFDHHLTKPADPERLLALLARLGGPAGAAAEPIPGPNGRAHVAD